MDEVDCVIVGAGVIGLAIARELARAGREVIVLEMTDAIGSGTSSRNSEVIHAGIYYAPGSLMARLCVEGREALYTYCRDHSIPYRACGKLIVACSGDSDTLLSTIQSRAIENGVDDLQSLSRAQAVALEPAIDCSAALLSPSTGIIDTHRYMLALQGDAEDAGATIAFCAPMIGGSASRSSLVVLVGGVEPIQLRCRMLINAAGLYAPVVARTITAMQSEHVPKAYFAKGNYFAHTGRVPFSRLIYPAPIPGALGIHLTLDMAGQGRFGPDIEWLETQNVETLDYNVDSQRGQNFYAAIRRYWPGLRDGALTPAYSGIRPKIVPPEIASQDFIIQGPREHGVEGLMNLFGIESPGLTSSLALAAHVVALINDTSP